MRWLILCREPRLYSCQRLKAAAEQQGYAVDILDPNRFVLQLQQGELCCQYHSPSGERHTLPRYLGILPRFGSSSTEQGCRVLHHFERQGIACLNTAMAFRLARDKWQSLQTLVAAGLPVPDTALAGSLVNVPAWLAEVPLPMVIKTLSGSQGVGVMLGEGRSSTASLLATLQGANVSALVQQFVAESQGQDIRAFVIGDQVVAAMARFGVSGDFRANIHQGGRAAPITLSEAERQLAVQASQVLGLDVAGVDLIRSHAGTQILEVNASPGLEMIEQISQAPIAEKMVAALLQKIAQN